MSADRPSNVEPSRISATPISRRRFLTLAGVGSTSALLAACSGAPANPGPDAPSQTSIAASTTPRIDAKPAVTATAAPAARVAPADSFRTRYDTWTNKGQAIEAAYKSGHVDQARKDGITLVTDGVQLLNSVSSDDPKLDKVNATTIQADGQSLDLNEYTSFVVGHALVETRLHQFASNPFVPGPFFGEVLALPKRAELVASPDQLFLFPGILDNLSRYAAISTQSGAQTLPTWQYSAGQNSYDAKTNIMMSDFRSPGEAIADHHWQQDAELAQRFEDISFNRPKGLDPFMVTVAGSGFFLAPKELFLATVGAFAENGVDYRRQLKAAEIRALIGERDILTAQYDLIRSLFGGQEFDYDARPRQSGSYHKADVARIVDLRPDLNESGIPLRSKPTYAVRNRQEARRLYGVNGKTGVELIDEPEVILESSGQHAITLWLVRGGIVDAHNNFLTYPKGTGEGYLPEEWLGAKIVTTN